MNASPYPWVKVSPELGEALPHWRNALTQVWSAWKAVADQLASMPPTDSPVQLEDRVLAELHPDWEPRQALNAGRLSVRLVHAAAEHVLGLAALVEAQRLTLPPYPLVRAEVEHLARAGWILDPDISPDARIARAWLEQLHGAHHYRWAMSASRAGNAQVRAARRHREQIREEVIKRFPEARLPAWDSPELAPDWDVSGEMYPSLAKACRRFVEFARLGPAHGLYDVLSLIAHPSPQELGIVTQTFVVNGRVEDRFAISQESVLHLLGMAAVTLYRGAWVMCSYFGLDGDALEGSADSMMELAPSLFAPATEPGAPPPD